MGKIIELPVGSQLEIGKAGSLKPDFHIYTAGIEPDRHNDRLVHMTGSSTEEDLQGDSMSIHALNSMTEMAPNLTIWLNHDYTLPDSIFGSVQGRAGIFHQNGIADLKFASDVEMENPAAARVKKYIDNGRRLGCSVGCMVTKYEVPEPDDGDDWFERGITIHGVHVVEFSIVGIPCNQRSWVENGIKGVFQRTLDPRLVPAMKSLWPRQYRDFTSLLRSAGPSSENLIEQFDAMPERTRKEHRINWHAPTKTFIFSGNGLQKSIEREDLAAYLAGSSKELRGEVVEIEEDDVEQKDIDAANLDSVKSACGSTSWPLDMNSSWDKGSAHGRILEWAGGKDNFSTSKMKSVHFRYDGDGSKITDYHLPFCDVHDGKVTAVWHAIVAVAGALGGARGGLSSEGDEGAIRSKVAHYYHKAGKEPPWSNSGDGEKSMNRDEIVGFAINKDGSAGIGVTKSGNHGPTVGTHKHFHPAHGHNDAEMHHHEHTHDGDNIHNHDHAKVPESHIHSADSDNDGDVDTNPPTGDDAHKGVEPEVKKEQDSVLVPELDEATKTQLAAYNTFGKILGMPEITPAHYMAKQHPVTKSSLSNEHMGHVAAIHDHAAAMGGCSYVNNANGTTVSDARNEAAYGAGRNVVAGDHMDGIGRLSEVMGSLAKTFEGLDLGGIQKDVGALKSEMGEARKQVDALYVEAAKAAETVKALKEMPLGNPVHHTRSVLPSDEVVSHQELLAVKDSQVGDTRESAFAMTTIETQELRNGMKMSYRRWPAAVGKGVRPDLTTNQRTFMQIEEIRAYEAGLDARVPLIDDPVC